MGSLPKRYCAMDGQCTQLRFLGEPGQLRSTSQSEICEPCHRAGLTPSKAASEGLPEHKQKRCASCGEFREKVPLSPLEGFNNAYLLCPKCMRRRQEGEHLYAVFTPEFEPPGPPEEGFSTLFKAARVLLRERVTDEDQIIPTLVEAYWRDLRGMDRELPRVGGSANVYKIVKFVDGIFIVESDPASSFIIIYEGEDRSKPLEVLIEIPPHKKALDPGEVGALYESTLAAKGIPCDSPGGYAMGRDFVENKLYLRVTLVKESRLLPGVRPGFPPPHRVEEFYDLLMKKTRAAPEDAWRITKGG